MSISATAFARYLSGGGHDWRQQDYDAKKFIDAVKGEAVNGFATVPVRGVRFRLDQSNAHMAVHWFAQMACDYLTSSAVLQAPFVFVPVPDSSCTSGSKRVSKTYTLAKGLADMFENARVHDMLRWESAMTPSHQGGSRNPQLFYDDLVFVKDIPKMPIILVDDVITTAGHVTGIAARIAREGGEVEHILSAGKTVWQQEDETFGVFELEFEDFNE